MKIFYIASIVLLLIGCGPKTEQSPPPTPPSTMSELLNVLSNGGAEARIGAAATIGSMGSDASVAVPLLIKNLEYEGPYEVREAAAIALGKIGANANPAIPSLISIMNDDFVFVQQAAAWALGEIDDTSAIPMLVEIIYDNGLVDNVTDSSFMIKAAEAIEKLTSQEFIGRQGEGYLLDEDNVPLIVLSAREWWEEEGQYQDWPDIKTPVQ